MTGGFRFRDYWPLIWLVVFAAIVGPVAVLKDVMRGTTSPMALVFASAVGAALMLVSLGLWLLVESRKGKTRPQGIAACARRLGWSFEASGASFDFAEWAGLQAFAATPLERPTRDSRRAQNVMRGARGGFEVIVLDVGDGADAYTVACLRSSSLNLPDFRLGGRGEADDPRELVFDGHPGFARAYSVVGDDEPAVRSVFTPAVLDFFSTHKQEVLHPRRGHLDVEGSGQRLVVFPSWELTSPKRIPALVEQSLTIARLFSGPGVGHEPAASPVKWGADEDHPWLQRRDWAARVVVDDFHSGRRVVWRVIVWAVPSGLVGFLAYLAITLDPGDPLASYAPAVLLLPLLGAIPLVRWARHRRRFGRPLCRLATLPGVIGGWFKATVETRLPGRPSHGVQASLVNSTRHLRDGSTETHWRTEWRIPATSVQPLGVGRFAIPVGVQIPRDIPSAPIRRGWMRWGSITTWRLELKASLPGMDYRAEFEVPVYRTGRAPADEQRPD